MSSDDRDPDLERVFAAEVGRGKFTTVEEARADFDIKMDQAIADAEAGLTEDAEVVFARLRERYAQWPRAAE